MNLRYGSVCSGIEAATMAWHPLGWQPRWFAEIDPFCCAVLAHHYPDVPNLGDFTQIGAERGPIDILVGGTPCQSFSVAGRRAGLADPRGVLAFEFIALARRLRPRWLVFENVPGLLSSNGGWDFGAFLGALAECGYGFAYRVLDAQHFGVPQRRRRVFVVGHLGNWTYPAAVLFERACLSGNIEASGQAGPRVAASITSGTGNGSNSAGRRREDDVNLVACALTANGVGTCGADDNQAQAGHLVAAPLTSNVYADRAAEENNLIPTLAHTLSCEGADASEDGTGRGVPLVFDWQASHTTYSPVRPQDGLAGTIGTTKKQAIAFTERSRQNGRTLETQEELAYALTNPGSGGRTHSRQIAHGATVRRLLPTECEALQGFPRDFTLVPYRGKPASDSVRYRAIGNSMAVPNMRWIGERIEQVEAVRRAMEGDNGE